METTNAIRQRSEIPAEDKWAIEDLYATDEAWEQEMETIAADQEYLASFAGHLGESPEKLLAYLERTERSTPRASCWPITA